MDVEKIERRRMAAAAFDKIIDFALSYHKATGNSDKVYFRDRLYHCAKFWVENSNPNDFDISDERTNRR